MEEDLDDFLNTKSDSNPRSNILKKLRGPFFGLLSAFCLSISNIYAKKANLFNGSEVALVSLVLIFLTMLATVIYRGEDPLGPKNQRVILFTRAVFVSISIISMKFAVKLISPADSTAILHTNLIIVAVMSRIIFKEVLSWVHIFCLLMAVIGVFCVSQPSFLTNLFFQPNDSKLIQGGSNMVNYPKIFGLCLAISAAFFLASATILLKKLNNSKVHFTVNLIYPGYVGIPLSTLFTILIHVFEWEKRPQEVTNNRFAVWLQIIFILVSAFGSLFNMLFFNIGVKYEDPAKMTIFRTTDLVFTFILQIFILNISLDLLSVIGAVLIFLSTFFITITKILQNK